MILPDRTKELGLPGLEVTNRDFDRYEARLQEPTVCTVCGSSHFNVEHRDREKNLIDLISPQDHPKVIDLHFLYTYYQCMGRTKKHHFFPRDFSFAAYKRHYTCRFELYVFKRCLTTNLKKLAYGPIIKGKISEKDVAEIFTYCTHRLDELVPKRIAPVHTLYIHRSLIKGVTFYSICNLEDGMLIEMLPDCTESSLSVFAARMDLSQLEAVWIDIDDRLLSAVSTVFPDAEICSGKREVQRFIRSQLPLLADEFGADKGIKMALSMERDYLSRHSTKRLNDFIEQNPEIEAYYKMDELLGDVSRSWTLSQLRDWVESIPIDKPSLFGLKASLTNFLAPMNNSVGKNYLNKEGHDTVRIAEGHLESIDHSHEELRKASMSTMRARALYGELLKSPSSLDEYLDEQGKFKTENDILFEDVIKRCVHTVSKGKQELLLGQPLEEVDARLRDIVAMDADERRAARKRRE